MSSPRFRITSLEIIGLWGRKDVRLDFFPDVNIVIGPNASGKTTVLNIIYYVFSGSLYSLAEMEFKTISFFLASFSGSSTRTVVIKKDEEHIRVKISQQQYKVPLAPSARLTKRLWRGHRDTEQVREALQNLVPAAWLPVSRRLPVADEEDAERPWFQHSASELMAGAESVDQKLRELLSNLKDYRLTLEARLSARYKTFHKHVLQAMLFDPEHDSFPGVLSELRFTDEDKQQLVQAFGDMGLYDKATRRRIEEHFRVARDTLERVGGRDREARISIKDLPMFPLLHRTKQMVDLARKLEEDRELIFDTLYRYESAVNGFFAGKGITVSDDGRLHVRLLEGRTSAPSDLDPTRLSSGEKQILILLTQALVYEDTPVVYVADEPELSLHVMWQERLVHALSDLSGEAQIIVATHSPDIVSDHRNKVIELGRG